MTTLTVGPPPRSTVTGDGSETSTIAMSSIIFVSVPTPFHTLKPLRRKGKRPTPFERMESSTRQTEGVAMTTDTAQRSTAEHVYDAPCPRCNAGPGEGCWSLRRGTTEACAWPHKERKAEFRRLTDGT